MQTLSEQTRKTGKLDPRLIQVKPSFNIRDFSRKEIQDGLAELSASIQEVGVRVPVTVKFDKDQIPWLVDGERRLRASMALIQEGQAIQSIPCVIEERGANDADLFFYQRLRNDGVKFTRLEDSQWVTKMLTFGWTVEDIAKKWGKTPQVVNDLLVLAEAPQAVKQMVKDSSTEGKVGVSASLAIKTVKEVGAERAVKVLSEAVEAAKAAGSSKATKKHTEGPKKDFLTKEESREAISILRHALSTAKTGSLLKEDIEHFLKTAGVDLA